MMLLWEAVYTSRLDFYCVIYLVENWYNFLHLKSRLSLTTISDIKSLLFIAYEFSTEKCN
jgi:hypothetical protein